MMEKWEVLVKSYTSQSGQAIDPRMRAAALLGMCPHDLLDTVANLSEPEDPDKLAEAMRMYVSNRASSLNLSKKDLGQVQEHEYYQEEYTEVSSHKPRVRLLGLPAVPNGLLHLRWQRPCGEGLRNAERQSQRQRREYVVQLRLLALPAEQGER